MIADPYPNIVNAILDGQCTVVKADSHRPVVAQSLKLQGRMTGILFKKFEVLAGQLLNFMRERVETLPELGRRSVHLDFSQLSTLLCCFSLAP